MQNKKKLKIGFFIPNFIPAWRFGGPVNTTYELGKRLAQKGHQVNIYCTDVSNNRKIRINQKLKKIQGMRIYYFRNLSNKLASNYKLFFPFEMRNYLTAELEKLDIIQIQDVYTIISFWLLKANRKFKKPIFVSPFGGLSPLAQGRFRFIRNYLNKILIRLLQKADVIFAQTIEEKNTLQKFGLLNTEILQNGINIQQFQNLPSKMIFRKKFGYSKNDIIILYLGRINRIKGLDYLLKAFSEIKNRKNLKLVLIGPDDNYLNVLIKLIKHLNLNNDVRIIKGLYGDEKIEAFSGSDIFCLPSNYDCCPNSMLEALASGLPVITTNTNGLSYLVRERTGIVIPPKDIEKLKNALIYFIKNPKKIKEFGSLGREKIINRYDWKILSDLLESYYYKFLKK